MLGRGVSSRNVRAMVAGLEAVGLDGEGLAREAGLEPGDLDDPERYVDGTRVFALWRRAAEAHGGPVGLEVGTRIPDGAYGVTDYLVASCATVGDALRAFARFLALGTTTSRYHVIVAADGSGVRFESEPLVPEALLPDHVRDYALAVLVTRIRRCQPAFSPSRVELRGGAAATPEQYGRLFGCPVAIGRPRTALVLPMTQWELALERADEGLESILARHARDLLRVVPAPTGPVDRARDELVRMLATGRADVQTLARRLSTSTRTLQRRLREHGVAYSQLLDEARFGLARAYLSDRSLSVQEVSALLGYSEPSAFTRAFKRWSGTTPAAHRGQR